VLFLLEQYVDGNSQTQPSPVREFPFFLVVAARIALQAAPGQQDTIDRSGPSLAAPQSRSKFGG